MASTLGGRAPNCQMPPDEGSLAPHTADDKTLLSNPNQKARPESSFLTTRLIPLASCMLLHQNTVHHRSHRVRDVGGAGAGGNGRAPARDLLTPLVLDWVVLRPWLSCILPSGTMPAIIVESFPVSQHDSRDSF